RCSTTSWQRGFCDKRPAAPTCSTSTEAPRRRRLRGAPMTGSPLQPAQPFWLVVLAASAGGLFALQTVLGALPRSFPAAVVVVLHRASKPESMLAQILARTCEMPVTTVEFGDPIKPGCIYVGRPDLHLTVSASKRFAYVDGTRIRGVLSSANP